MTQPLYMRKVDDFGKILLRIFQQHKLSIVQRGIGKKKKKDFDNRVHHIFLPPPLEHKDVLLQIAMEQGQVNAINDMYS